MENISFLSMNIIYLSLAIGFGTIAFAVLGMFFWSRSLRALVDQKTEQFRQELNDRMRAEEALQRARDELEARVEERTGDLRYANEQLQLEIIEHKLTEAKLSESEERFRLLAEFAPFGILLQNQYGEMEYVNPRFTEIFGYSIADIPPEWAPLESAFPCDKNREGILWGLKQDTLQNPATGSARDITVSVRCKDGTEKTTSVRSVFVGNGKHLLCLEDVTERLKVEEERARLATAVEQASEFVIILDLGGCIQYVNLAFEKTTGYTRAELMGKHLSTLESGQNGSDSQTAIVEALRSGKVWRGHLTGKAKSGGDYEVEATFSPIRSATGEIISFASVQRDVTNVMSLEKQLRQAQKMEAIGTLAGGIAHDFNNILAAIMGYTEMSIHMIPKGSLAQLNLEQVLKAADRARDLVKQILLFSRRGEQEIHPLLISSTVKEALKLLRASLPATIEFRQSITVDPESQILGDPTQIHQVMLNLCTNAAHAMREKGGILEVELAEAELSAPDLASDPELKPGPYLRLTVKDTGHGMAKAVLDRVFEPFFTTKEPFEGTGMGLAVVHGIVKHHEGLITVLSEPDQGTTFHVFFPKITGGETGQLGESKTIPRGYGHILFVDDEEALIRLGQEMLESLGYEVTIERNAIDALKRFQSQPDRFDLVITDYTMPKMTGLELGREILRVRPAMPVILCSGYSEMVSEEKAKEMGIREFVMKPFSIQELAGIILKVLEQD